MIPLLGTDNGYIVRQDPVAGWQIVFDDGGSHDPFTDVLYSLLTNPSATQSLWCYHTTFDGTYPALSSPNGGQTWNVGSNQPNPNEFLGIDAAGNLYATVLYGGLQKSTDNGASWFTIYTPPGADQLAFQNVFVANGSVWFINLVGNTLMRCNLDGSGSTAYPAASLADGQDTIMGGGSSNRLLIYAASQSSDLLTVDITNPDNPTFTSVPNPFGATQVPVSVVPITNAVVLALTYDTDPDVQAGQLWRSADGGVTWTSVVGLTKQLQPGGVTGPVLLAADPGNSNNVWGATTIPYVYTSTDQGQTWTVETVDLDLGGGFGWTTLTLAGPGMGPGTPIRATDIQNLIDQINAVRAGDGLSPFPWTDPTITSATPIRALQFNEMSQALQGAWTFQGLGTIPAWSVGTPSPGTLIHGIDLNDVASWLATAEATLGIWVGFHWCNPESTSANSTAKNLLIQSGSYGVVILLDPNNSTQYYDACDQVLAAHVGSDLSQSIVRLYWGTEGDPNLSDVSCVSAADLWLDTNGFYTLIDYFVVRGGQMAVIFNELDMPRTIEPQGGIDPRVMGYLSHALHEHTWSNGSTGIITLFPGPSGLKGQDDFTDYWTGSPSGGLNYDLWSSGSQQTFGNFYGSENVDGLIADKTMLFHNMHGVFDGVALHCYAHNTTDFVSPDTSSSSANPNPALQYLLWLWNDVDQTGPVYVTESGNFSVPADPMCSSDPDYDSTAGDTAANGRALAQFQAIAASQFGPNGGPSSVGTFLRAIYGFILEDSNCGATAGGRTVIGTNFMTAWVATITGSG